MKRPIVLTAVISVLISVYSLFSDYIGVWILFFAILALLIYYLFCLKTSKYLFVFIVALLSVTNLLLVYKTSVLPFNNINGGKYNVTCTVLETEYGEENAICVVRIKECTSKSFTGKKVLLYTNEMSVKAGNTLRGVMSFYDFYGEQRIINYSENIFAYGGIEKISIYENPKSIYAVLENLRVSIEKTIFKNVGYSEAATITGILLGRRSYQTPLFKQNVIKCGVSHVMVVSGMHMAIICGLVLKFFRKSKLNKVLATLITAAFTIFFMALCGFTPSVLRAGIMYFILLASMLTFHRRDALSALCSAVVIIVLINPFITGSVSFCLSAAATAGIIVINPVFNRLIRIEKIKSKFLVGIINIVTVTVSALIATLPITLVKFGGISIVSVLSNLLISTAVTLVLNITFAGLLLTTVPGINCLSPPIFKVAEWICKYINFVINCLGELPFSYINFN